MFLYSPHLSLYFNLHHRLGLAQAIISTSSHFMVKVLDEECLIPLPFPYFMRERMYLSPVIVRKTQPLPNMRRVQNQQSHVVAKEIQILPSLRKEQIPQRLVRMLLYQLLVQIQRVLHTPLLCLQPKKIKDGVYRT